MVSTWGGVFCAGALSKNVLSQQVAGASAWLASPFCLAVTLMAAANVFLRTVHDVLLLRDDLLLAIDQTRWRAALWRFSIAAPELATILAFHLQLHSLCNHHKRTSMLGKCGNVLAVVRHWYCSGEVPFNASALTGC